MQRSKNTLLVMGLVLAAFGTMIPLGVNAESRIKKIPGANVTVTGLTVTKRATSFDPGGRWTCSCAIQGGVKTGTCTLKESNTSLTCTKEAGDTCTTTCTFVKQPGRSLMR